MVDAQLRSGCLAAACSGLRQSIVSSPPALTIETIQEAFVVAEAPVSYRLEADPLVEAAGSHVAGQGVHQQCRNRCIGEASRQRDCIMRVP
jgi:hypothetical protein